MSTSWLMECQGVIATLGSTTEGGRDPDTVPAIEVVVLTCECRCGKLLGG